MLTVHPVKLASGQIQGKQSQSTYYRNGQKVIERVSSVEHCNQFAHRLQYTTNFTLRTKDFRNVVQDSVTEDDVEVTVRVWNLQDTSLSEFFLREIAKSEACSYAFDGFLG